MAASNSKFAKHSNLNVVNQATHVWRPELDFNVG